LRRRSDRSSLGGVVPGALVLGGDYRALGVVRSLGRRGIPVWVLRVPHDHRLAALSRYCRREVLWHTEDDEGRRGHLVELARRHGLTGWVLFPSADATAAFVSRQHAVLSRQYVLTTPPWEVFREGYDKRCTVTLARRAGVAHPWTAAVPSRAEVERYAGPFPVIVKPATKPWLNRPVTKAWPAYDRAALLRSYEEAAAETEPGTLMLQELIPGRGHAQFSFAALCAQGRAVASVTAERVRQQPPDFGRSSTFVVTVDEPDVERAGRRVLEELGLTGLAEVEFKRDPRDDSYRLLDINLRVWGWHTVARCAGLDFPYLAWRMAIGRPVDEVHAPAGLRWLRLTTDVAAGLTEIAHGDLSTRSYLRSLAGRHERAVAAGDDPVPGLAEVPLFLWSRLRGPGVARTTGGVPNGYSATAGNHIDGREVPR